MNYYAGIGARETPEEVLKQMESISSRMRELGYTLRSGGARGADTAFESNSGSQKEIYLPYRGFANRVASTSVMYPLNYLIMARPN
jgi:hypothetical protein